MRCESQLDLMRLLQLVCRHFTAAVLSTRTTVLSDAARILTLACLAAIADAVARRTACDVPSLFAQHYAGIAPGPCAAFGFELGDLRGESETMRFHDALLLARRTDVLDYFDSVAQHMLDTCEEDEILCLQHTLFRFEVTMQFGEAERRLLSQLTWTIG